MKKNFLRKRWPGSVTGVACYGWSRVWGAGGPGFKSRGEPPFLKVSVSNEKLQTWSWVRVKTDFVHLHIQAATIKQVVYKMMMIDCIHFMMQYKIQYNTKHCQWSGFAAWGEQEWLLPIAHLKWSWGELFIALLPLVKQYYKILKSSLLELSQSIRTAKPEWW